MLLCRRYPIPIIVIRDRLGRLSRHIKRIAIAHILRDHCALEILVVEPHNVDFLWREFCLAGDEHGWADVEGGTVVGYHARD